jgi:hypothetical protein
LDLKCFKSGYKKAISTVSIEITKARFSTA